MSRSAGWGAGRALEILLGALALGFAFMVATVPLVFALLASVGTVSLLARSAERHAVGLVAGAVLAMIGLAEVALRALPRDAGPQYYRPHEVLAGHEVEPGLLGYRPNERLEGFAMPYGGLAKLGSFPSIEEPRIVEFQTDGLGFRNRSDYAGQPFVLLGDSFVVGTANTQDTILSEVLSRSHGIPVYNAGYPGEIRDYVARLRLLERRHGTGFRAVLVAFEGNDFRCRSSERVDPEIRWHRAFEYIPSGIRRLESYRVLFGLTRRIYHLHLARDRVAEDLTVLVERHGEQDVGFLKSYVEKARSSEACHWEEERRLLESVADRLALLVFVPTKYRVYASLPGSPGGPLPPSAPSAFLRRLAEDRGIPYLDLTPPLVEASERLLDEGRYTFWRDDTHWNPEGLRVAAAALAARLRAEGLVGP